MKKLGPKKMRYAFLAVIFAGAFLGMISAATAQAWLAVCAVILLLSSCVLHYVFYRCPHCDAYLDRSWGEYCPHCGKKLEE